MTDDGVMEWNEYDDIIVITEKGARIKHTMTPYAYDIHVYMNNMKETTRKKDIEEYRIRNE